MNSLQTITKNELYDKGPISITDGDWSYNISLIDRLEETPIDDKRIEILVMYSGDRNIKRIPTEQPRIVLPNTKDYEISYAGLFMLCTELVNIGPLRYWDISNVIDIRFMFAGCTSLKDISPLRYWNISHVKRLDGMFMSCHNLADLTALSKWDLSSCVNSSVMFFHCYSLTTLNGLENWKMPNNITTSCMFSDCYKLSDISSVHDWDVSHIHCLSAMFEECDIEDVSPLENWFVSAPEVDMRSILSGNLRISDIDSLSNWRWHVGTDMKRIFNGCYQLRNHPLILQWMNDNPEWLTGYTVDDEDGTDEWIEERDKRRAKYDPCRICMRMLEASYFTW